MASVPDLPRIDEPMVLSCQFRPDAFCTVHGGIHVQLDEPEQDGPEQRSEDYHEGYADGYADAVAKLTETYCPTCGEVWALIRSGKAGHLPGSPCAEVGTMVPVDEQPVGETEPGVFDGLPDCSEKCYSSGSDDHLDDCPRGVALGARLDAIETDAGPSCDHPACQPGGSLHGVVHAHAVPTIEVAGGHVVHQCCGKLDDAAHRNFCEHYRPAGGTR
jgi:hypothetical protein